MASDIKTLAAANPSVQVLLITVVFIAAFMARKSGFEKHCTIMRVLLPPQIISIAGAMLPLMPGYLENEQSGILFNTEMLIHHTFGLAVVALWVYVNLALRGVIKMWGRLVIAMRLAFALWVLTFLDWPAPLLSDMDIIMTDMEAPNKFIDEPGNLCGGENSGLLSRQCIQDAHSTG